MQRKQGNNPPSGFSRLQKEKKTKKLVIWTLLKASNVDKCSSKECSWSPPGAHMTGWFHQKFLATPKNEKQTQESVWEHVHLMCTWDEPPPRDAMVEHSFSLLRRMQVLKKKLFLRQGRRNVHVLALHICNSKQNTVRGSGAGPPYFCTGPLSPCQERDRYGYFSVNRDSQRSIYQFDP